MPVPETMGSGEKESLFSGQLSVGGGGVDPIPRGEVGLGIFMRPAL